jgi:prepilin-type N-terminal cleavage/methylation domain-containing protein
MKTTSRRTARAGFTLVELLVVIGIITLLAAILVVAIGRAGTIAKEQATAATIRKISNQVQERLEALDRLKSQPQWAQDAQAFAALYDISFDQAKVLLLKFRMKRLFPQRFADMDPHELSQQIVNNPQYPYDGSKHIEETESSELLYYALTRGAALGIPTVDPAEYKSSEVADTDGDGLLEFVDAWGKPLRFYRWPTRLFANGTWDTSATPPLPVIDRTRGATVLFKDLPPSDADLRKDQDDPTLLLYDANPNAPIMREFTEAKYHTPRTYHHFLIVSSGPDGLKHADPSAAFGLYAPTDTANFGYLAQPTGNFDALTDNITNRNR